MQRFALTLALFALALSIPSCKRKAKPQIPVFVPQAPTPPEPKTTEELPPPPESMPAPGDPTSQNPLEIIREEFPKTPAAPVERPAPPAVPPTPAPRLEPIMPEEQRRRLLLEADASLSRAQRQVATIARRTLNTEQRASLDRIRAFIKQAGALRQSDLATAHGLARRADILSAELLESTQ